MSANTKIVVLRMKELIYTGIIAAVGIILIILLVAFFIPDKKEEETDEIQPSVETLSPTLETLYIPGKYTTELILGGQTASVEVIVSPSEIISVSISDPSETVTSMYPLLLPTMEDLSAQICQMQSLENIEYSPESKYTSMVLLEAVRTSLEKAENAR